MLCDRIGRKPVLLALALGSAVLPALLFLVMAGGGWPRILSNLKSLLETGEGDLKEKST